jgi:hypothetical protein
MIQGGIRMNNLKPISGSPSGHRFWNPASGSLSAWTHAVLLGGALLLLGYYWWSPKIPFNDGFGWDGAQYARWVSSLPEELLSGSLDSYYVKRILPSFLVSLPARVLGLPITRDYIVYGFCIGNALCAYLTGLFWFRICAALAVSGPQALLGLVLLVANYPVIKQSGYYGVLTDLFALAAATAMLDCWIRGQRRGLAIAVLASMFCWASTSILGSLLLLFPRGSMFSLGRLSRYSVWTGWIGALGYAAAGIAGSLALVILHKQVTPVAPWLAFLPLSILIASAYIYLVARTVLEIVSTGEGEPQLTGCTGRSVFFWFLLIPGVVLVQRIVAPGTFAGALRPEVLILGSISRPGLFLVGDFSYYGTIAVLGALFLPAVVRKAGELGLGLLGAVAFGLALNLYPESRMSLNVAPFFVLPLTLALPNSHLTASQWVFVAVCQFATSKIWLPIAATAADFSGSLQAYPAQFYFASHGPWMANDAFLVQGAAALVAVTIAVRLFRPAFLSQKSPAE